MTATLPTKRQPVYETPNDEADPQKPQLPNDSEAMTDTVELIE